MNLRAIFSLPIVMLAVICLRCAAPLAVDSTTPYKLGLEALERNDLGAAITQFTLAIEKSENVFFTAAYLKRGECYLQRTLSSAPDNVRHETIQRALDDFERVLGQSELSVGERARSLYLQGEAHRRAGEIDPAIDSFHQVLQLPVAEETTQERLRTHTVLGRILLESALVSYDAHGLSEQTADTLRRAQREFAAGLKIDPNEPFCNRGKGICLFYLRQHGHAVDLLERSTQLSEQQGQRNPRGHFYLGRALGAWRGPQLAALEHYRKALAQDRDRKFTRLYRHLIDVIEDYVPFDTQAALFEKMFEELLLYAGEDTEYWRRVEARTNEMIASDIEGKKLLGRYGRALARARQGKIEAAVDDSIALAAASPQLFLTRLKSVFSPPTPLLRDHYGRGLTLYRTGRHEELDLLYREELPELVTNGVDVAEKGRYYYLLRLLYGRNIVELWRRSETSGEEVLLPEDHAPLEEAKAALRSYLTEHENDPQVRLDLGDVEEILKSYVQAYTQYDLVIASQPDHTEAFRRVLRLHRDGLLQQLDHARAWTTLKSYRGEDPEIVGYIAQVSAQIETKSRHSCRRCGHQGQANEDICQACGRRFVQRTPMP